MSETLICIAEEVGIRAWLERVLGDTWTLEFVSAGDLSRVNRLVQASQAKVVVAAVNETEQGRSAKLFSAILASNPAVSLVAVAQHISQELLLEVMRAGARDCLITGVDGDRASERILALSQLSTVDSVSKPERVAGSLTLVLGAASVVDTRFFAQNLACELSHQQSKGSVLAIDTMATENRSFYLDSLNRLSLNDLVNRTDAIDQAFVNTALEEYSPGLRLLSGNIMAETLTGDDAADLFIAVSRLAELFDHMVIRVVEHQAKAWLKILGSDITKLVILAHPVVDQVQYTEAMIQQSRKWLGQSCESLVVIDGYRKGATLKLEDIEKNIGLEASLRLPVEWLNRLDSINAGVPLGALPRSSPYQKRLVDFVHKHYVESPSSKGPFAFFNKR